MNIVMLEPLGVKPEALEAAFAPFVAAGHNVELCTAKITEEEKIARAKDADIFVIANSPLSADVINAAEHLQMVCVAFTGIDHVNLDACRAKGVRVCNAQGYATEATAEVAIGMMLSCLRNLVPYDKSFAKAACWLATSTIPCRAKPWASWVPAPSAAA